MATFRTCVQKQRKDGFYPVYIHVTHLKKSMWFVNMNYGYLRCGGGLSITKSIVGHYGGGISRCLPVLNTKSTINFDLPV